MVTNPDAAPRPVEAVDAQEILDAAPDAILAVDHTGRIVLANTQAETLFGYSRSDLIGELIEILVPDRAKPDHPSYRNRFFSTPETRPMGTGLNLAGRRSDGSEFPAEISLSAIKTANGRLALAAVRDITDRMRAQEEAKKAREEADSANRAKSEFLSRMSHELRTPLNAVLGFAQLLEMESESERDREAIDQILKGGRHLLALINEVLDITQIEARTLPMSLEPVRVLTIAYEVVELLASIAAGRQIEVSVEANCDLWVQADSQRLTQVLLNLVSNAIKYNKVGGSVSITCDQKDQKGLVEVSDTGFGIAPDMLGRLFTPFDRLGAEATGEEGTGLGLSLSRGLIEAMGGTMHADSQVGRGTKIRFEIALAGSLSTGDESGTAHEPLSELDAESISVLYIEDNLANLTLLEKVFEVRPQFKLHCAMQGSLGVDLASSLHPDVILLDLHLPDMPGERVLQRLKSDPATQDIPVIMITADAFTASRKKLLASGAAGYLVKPLNLRELFEAISIALSPD